MNNQSLRIALCQINPTVGDLQGNSHKILEFYRRAVQSTVPDLILFPECSLPGYPPEDLVLKKSFLRANFEHLNRIAKEIKQSIVILGFVQGKNNKAFNSAAVIKDSKILTVYSKHSLPNYGVFDEKRYFSAGQTSGIIQVKGIPVGLSICEDIWEENSKINPCLIQAKLGAKILLNISASPYSAEKFQVRIKLLKKRTQQTRCPIVYVNMVGGQDELIFDGRSMVLDNKGNIVVLGRSFEEDLKFVELKCGAGQVWTQCEDSDKEPLLEEVEEIYSALVLGTRDYVEKNKFKNVVIGLSGGIDSSLTACVAVDALGRDRVLGVTMPSRYSSGGTIADAKTLAKNLGINCWTISIEKIFSSFLKTLTPIFTGGVEDALSCFSKGLKPNIAEENLQSRIRGTILMALSNKFGHLVLTTGNKSEVSVGYCTLYGDTAGGFAMLKDVPKTVVYKVSRFVNKNSEKTLIPETVFRRAPTAELRPNQKDQDSLPPYELLDKIIRHYVEEDKSFSDLAGKGFKRAILAKVIGMIDTNEYKRRQSPPGIKITPKSFGKDRRMPITNRFLQS